MLHFSEHHHDFGQLDDRLHQAHAATADLMAEVIDETCRRFPPTADTEKVAQVERQVRARLDDGYDRMKHW